MFLLGLDLGLNSSLFNHWLSFQTEPEPIEFKLRLTNLESAFTYFFDSFTLFQSVFNLQSGLFWPVFLINGLTDPVAMFPYFFIVSAKEIHRKSTKKFKISWAFDQSEKFLKKQKKIKYPID